ncbi:MAG TPA: protease inhibitor I42 family protein, partial [Candidatus Bathyarchaeia archaeon]|nr:protease inhibitor I42 family protein [Candidatus Bathyarchaeia archaeon]
MIYIKSTQSEIVEKKPILLVGVVTALLTCTILIAGCASTSNSTPSTVSSQTTGNVSNTTHIGTTTPQAPITVAQDSNFSITLRANPSTGYHWEAQFDHHALSLTSSVFVSDANSHNLVGVPG